MKKYFFCLTLVLCVPAISPAQQVPAIENTVFMPPTYMPAKATRTASFTSSPAPIAPEAQMAPVQPPPIITPPPVNLLSDQDVKLDSKEQQAVNLANRWKNKPEMPIMGADGTLNFAFGQTLPSVICAPLYACDVTLEPGEVVTQVDVGDSVRWKITPAVSGSGNKQVTHLIIKPTDAGLTSNMIVSTDRRSYTIKLISRKDLWTPKVAFSYPEDVQAQWAAYTARNEQQVKTTPNFMTVSNVNGLDYGFRLKGDSPTWRPLRVYTDQAKTYIEFPPAVRNGETPALVVIGPDAKDQLVNYRMLGNQYVVDKVIQKAALISGVGHHQERVEIVREGGQ
jgi:P-type conjugative transfer protein TrbG